MTKSATQHLLMAGEVIWPFDAFDLEATVLTGLWASCFKNHHCPYRVCSLRIRDIVTLDALWWSSQVERFLQFFQSELRFLAISQPFDTLLL